MKAGAWAVAAVLLAAAFTGAAAADDGYDRGRYGSRGYAVRVRRRDDRSGSASTTGTARGCARGADDGRAAPRVPFLRRPAVPPRGRRLSHGPSARGYEYAQGLPHGVRARLPSRLRGGPIRYARGYGYGRDRLLQERPLPTATGTGTDGPPHGFSWEPDAPAKIEGMKSQKYWKEIAAFKQQLADAIPNDELKALHVRRPSAHLRVAARQFGIVAVCGWALWHFSNPLIWVPVAILQGFTFFNMTTLLHEVVHNSVFRSTPARLGARARPRLRDHERHLGQPVHPLAPRPPRQPRATTTTTPSGTGCRPSATRAGTSCSTARRC